MEAASEQDEVVDGEEVSKHTICLSSRGAGPHWSFLCWFSGASQARKSSLSLGR